MSSTLYEDNILASIKDLLNIPEDVNSFDSELVLHINSFLAVTNQIGVNPSNTIRIVDGSEKWSDFYSEEYLDDVRTYVYLRVKSVFDPPTASVLTSMDNIIKELEWRLNVSGDELLYAGDQNES